MINVGDFRIGLEEKEAINNVLDSGKISEGKKVREFEKEWAKYVGTKHAIAVSSGTAALIVGLRALKITGHILPFRQNVITTPITYAATTNALFLENYSPKYVDIDPETFVITPENIKAHLEEVGDPSKYSMILPVHLMGYPADMNEINKIAKKYNMITFEDSAQAHGTIYDGKHTGTFSTLADYSFYIAHNIQAGELGAVNTDNYEIIRIIRKLKANGRACDCPICTRNTTGCPKKDLYEGDPRFTHELIGYNFKTMEFQAALALCQLKKADWIKEQRNQNVMYLNEQLEGIEHLQLPKYSKDVSYFAYPLICKDINRKKLRIKLEKKGIESRPLFGCLPTQQPAFGFLKNIYKGRLPNAEHVGANGFYIGCHQYLTQDDLDYMIKTLKEVVK